MPPGGRGGDDGGCLRQAHRRAGHLHGHARAGSDQRQRRRPYRVPELDADDPVHRPDRARHGRARGLPGDRLPPHVRRDGEMGRADRRRGAHPRARQPRLPCRDVRPPRPGRARLARGHAAGRGRRRPIRRATAASRRIPAPRTCSACGRCWRRPNGRSRSSAAAAGMPRPARACSASRSAAAWPSLRASGGRITSTTTIPATSARLASAPIRRSRGGCGTPTCCCCSAAGSAKCRARATRCSTFPARSRRFVHVHAGAEELGRVYQADLPINAGARAFAAALDRLEPVDGTRWAAWREQARAEYEAWRRPPRNARRAADGRSDDVA